ncbi:MAG: DnaJ domain-containing protein, partial [Saprospiraceae bacterium]|nr:DnaJ domain-containing protein [Pyrinomonadaceae bacterium]
MTPQNTLDLKGNFKTHPFAEILAEIAQAKLSGSLRLSRGERKTIVYVNEGEIVYAVSNSREFRLFNVILGQHKIDKPALAQFPNLANDIEFAASLQEKGLFTKEQIDDQIVTQIKQIVVEALSWPEGEWLFSPLARLRENLVYDIGVYNVLTDYARCVPADAVAERFRSVQEGFTVVPERTTQINLQMHESYVLSIFDGYQMTIETLQPLCSLPKSVLLQALYVLWLGGILQRQEWNAAFSVNKLAHIRSSKMSLVKEAVKPAVPQAAAEAVPEEPATEQVEEPVKIPEKEISLEEYLERVEKAETHYDIMGVAQNAPISEIKSSYFSMAKLFHPDRYHRESVGIQRRVQVAFTGLAHAYETLKSPESRGTYDFKMRKELELREKRRAEGMPEAPAHEELKTESGLESFEHGLNALMEEDYGQAATHLSRAVHYSPENALYHAYYGHVLSFSEKFRHKAEGELQAASRLDPKNPKIRLMLAQFFIDMNMLKRAEGELNRFLEIAPDNKEARELL